MQAASSSTASARNSARPSPISSRCSFRRARRLADIVKTTVFLTDMADFDEMNGIYLECFAEPRPARSAVAVVALPRGARIEIEAWAFQPS